MGEGADLGGEHFECRQEQGASTDLVRLDPTGRQQVEHRGGPLVHELAQHGCEFGITRVPWRCGDVRVPAGQAMIGLSEHQEMDGGEQQDRELLLVGCRGEQRVERPIPGDHMAQRGVERCSATRVTLVRTKLVGQL